MELKETIKNLANVYGVSGNEYNASMAAADILKPYVDNVDIDIYGNVVGTRSCHKNGAPKLLLDAHVDQIGFMVSEITEDGFIHFSAIGGLDQRVLLGSDVMIITKNHGNVRGVIATIPPHLLILMDSSKATPIEEMIIDIGMSPERVKEVIQEGDFAVFAEEAFDMENDIVCGKAMDDRACIVCIVHALELLKEKELNCDLIITFTTKEEIGFHGAIVTGYTHPADLAIAVDVCHAKTADSTDADNVYDFEGGPVVTIGSNSLPNVARKLMELARAKKIPCQPSANADFSGTNAWMFQLAGVGIKTAIVSLPLKYMHTAVEMISIKDVQNVSRLLAEFALIYKG